MQQISAPQLKSWLDECAAGTRVAPHLLDIREPWEFEVCRIPDAKLMPMRSVPARFAELDRDADTVVICHHGARSYQVALFLEQQGFSNILNLYGGVAAWSQQVDTAMPTY
ncbi:MAG: rhodanese-like domain-containing protein [Proteobacteria bacterium]|nr:rhodanese-like domain-containing protein [Pseudomonadota bacterium]